MQYFVGGGGGGVFSEEDCFEKFRQIRPSSKTMSGRKLKRLIMYILR